MLFCVHISTFSLELRIAPITTGPGAHTTTVLVIIDTVKGGGRAPPPPLHQSGLIFPSRWNVGQKVAIATLCSLWSLPMYIVHVRILPKNTVKSHGVGVYMYCIHMYGKVNGLENLITYPCEIYEMLTFKFFFGALMKNKQRIPVLFRNVKPTFFKDRLLSFSH